MDRHETAVIAGTADARKIIEELCGIYSITAYTATEYGAELLKNCDCNVHTGCLDEEQFYDELRRYSTVIDATHPFAVEVSRNVRNVCEKLNIEYIRAGREKEDYGYDMIRYVKDKEDAVKYINNSPYKNILLTTGVNTLGFYEENLRDKNIFARILECADSRKKAENSHAFIIYSVPPFSSEDTYRLINEYDIDIIVSKDSGKQGGVDAKTEAARRKGIEIVIIESPEKENCCSAETIIEILKKRVIKCLKNY